MGHGPIGQVASKFAGAASQKAGDGNVLWTERKQRRGREELPDSSIATGIFAVLGTVVGAVLQAGGTRTQNQRRANGKVLAGVQQAHLECEAINSEFSKEDDLIKRAKEAQQPLPPMTYHEDLSFKDREARTWNLINKAQDAVTDNVLQLTVGFSQAYWKFYPRAHALLGNRYAPELPLQRRGRGFQALGTDAAKEGGGTRRALVLARASSGELGGRDCGRGMARDALGGYLGAISRLAHQLSGQARPRVKVRGTCIPRARVLAAWPETGLILNTRVRPRRVPLLGPAVRE